MKTYHPVSGEEVEDSIKAMLSLANERGEEIETSFNGIEITVKPGDNPGSVMERYETMKEVRAAPEY